MEERLWARKEFVSAEIDGSLVLLDLDTLVYHSLNATAAKVWTLLEEPRGKAALVDELCRTYRVGPEQCAASVGRLIDELAASNLIAPVETAA